MCCQHLTQLGAAICVSPSKGAPSALEAAFPETALPGMWTLDAVGLRATRPSTPACRTLGPGQHSLSTLAPGLPSMALPGPRVQLLKSCFHWDFVKRSGDESSSGLSVSWLFFTGLIPQVRQMKVQTPSDR